jgi:hypothetical protein
MVWTSGAGLVVNLTSRLDAVGSGPAAKREQYWPPYAEASAPVDDAGWSVGVALAAPPEDSLELPGLTKYRLLLTARASGATRPLTLLWYRCAAPPRSRQIWCARSRLHTALTRVRWRRQ